MRLEPDWEPDRNQGAVIIEVTYGPPEIKDIYDLGVPRDAKIVDMRVGDLTKKGAGTDLAKLAARLDERRGRDLVTASCSSQLFFRFDRPFDQYEFRQCHALCGAR